MRQGGPKSVPVSGPPGPAAVTKAAALQDVIDALKAVLTAPDLPTARTLLGLGNVANLAPADLPVSTAVGLVLATKAALSSPAFTGVPTAPTRAAGDSSTALATTGFVAAAIAALVNSSPAALDTLKELADALGDDPNFAATVATQLGLKAPLASPVFTGTPTAPTQSAGDNSQRLATTAFVVAALAAATGGMSNALLYVAQALTAGQQDQVRANILSALPIAPSANTTLTALDHDRPVSPTAAVTITAANAVGWRSGPVCNSTAMQALVTLAVPSGATLDGTANGTTTLYPYQVARLIQTGSTAYVTDWILRAPILPLAITTAVASADVAMPIGYTKARVDLTGINLGTAAAYLGLRFGDGAGVKVGANDYDSLAWNNAAVTNTLDTYGQIARSVAGGSTTFKPIASLLIWPGAAGQYPNAEVVAYRYDNSGNRIIETIGIDYTGTTSGAMGRATILRLLASSGSFTLNGTVQYLP